ncbi:D-glycero-beta-D-manno-heptose-7-phosphate kinase [Candidatus Woesearchaeota archaeon]|nr:MAG: ADP-heptose synthase, D-beta-D-heptose 7-phosphate kinase / D-beta-D-heptose 1-phosphate adenosyltransferase [archaeon GW2011_AR4]MBS3129422.1 D-glycero-beta-D-manno-heptose-7-phosphate kinase [Candidatus Woesearchaeota archaeon]HIH38463.1 D-glycero-beta-D-manno-heptose-7-phosphate kinase [Candidatus Woesearchaeota archaeon]HIH49797.1 D-glycero-beta-D-manno-heptose-7-phosphate kinase [Candidatus Woesearchaeota archaeon]HIJ03476.1 D-glycero-beta-D-manno-heptose-7-phosphate kinase [Candid
MSKQLQDALKNVVGKRILVIGDVMLDRYVWGSVERISPEAPIPICLVKRETNVPGGAGNTAANITAMKGKCTLLSVVGDDEARRMLNSELESRGIDVSAMVAEQERPTTRKTRVMGGQQQLLRLDFEDSSPIKEESRQKIIGYIKKNVSLFDCVVISDYAKGVIDRELAEAVVQEAARARKPLLVDPKPKHAKYFKGATLITPNHKEASEIAGIREEKEADHIIIGNHLVKLMGSDILITRGEKGMTLFQLKENAISVNEFMTTAREVYDVSGAGDTVVAALALSMAAGNPLELGIMLANIAAGIKVGKLGTAAVTYHEVEDKIMNIDEKIKSREQITLVAKQVRAEGKKIVTTNGSFDLLHAGHLKYLNEAKAQGDVLIVGLNSDDSVRRWKKTVGYEDWKNRPIIPEQYRARMLAALKSVDYVTIFDETEPFEFLNSVHPDVHVNGSEYGEKCIEADLIKSMGGRIHIVEKEAGLSTSEVIKKIKESK